MRPALFLRNEIIHSDDGESDEFTRNEFAFAARTLVLLHELGHAEDMARGINFDHGTQTVQVIPAEVYAHRFVFQHARKRNYRLALSYYIQDLEDAAAGEGYRAEAARRALAETDLDELKRFANSSWSDNPGSWEYRLAEERIRRQSPR